MNEKMREIIKKSKTLLKQITIYVIIVLTCVSSFFIGMFYTKLFRKEPIPTVKVENVRKKDVNLAVDQYNNLIVIDNKTGNYTIYQDSVGRTIFSLYAKNVWGQHNQVQPENQ